MSTYIVSDSMANETFSDICPWSANHRQAMDVYVAGAFRIGVLAGGRASAVRLPVDVDRRLTKLARRTIPMQVEEH